MTASTLPAARKAGVGPSPVLGLVAAGLIVAALVGAFIVAPTEVHMGETQRIFYFHVAAAWTAFLAFGLVCGWSIAYLRTRNARWDTLAASAAEIGVVFTSTALLSGSIWGHTAWGTWWTWEPRLTSTALLWLIYVSYLLLREMVEGTERRAVFSAVFGIIGFVDVPIVFMSIRWWRSVHPAVVGSEGFDMDAMMLPALLLSVAAFTTILVYLVSLRTSLARSSEAVEEIKERIRQSQEESGI